MKYCRYLHTMRKGTEQGSALVAALCLIFMAGMLTATVLALSRIATFDVRSHVELQRSAYINEGVANRIQFLLAADRNVNPGSTQLGELDYTEFDYDRYTADGIPHIIDYHGTEVQVVIHDAASGFNLNSSSYRNTLQNIANVLQLDDTEINNKMQTLIQRIADYIFAHGRLPNNFITKKQARSLGWDSAVNYVSDVAPGMSIGGDYYGNYEKLLPKVENRLYYEADCFYRGGKRNQYRIVFSNDCHVWYTEDHYQTFIELFPSKEESE